MALRRTVPTLQRISQLACSSICCERRSSLPLGLRSPRRHLTSSPNSTPESQILTHSSILLQDGLDIQELPLVIRRMTEGEMPVLRQCYPSEERREKATEQDQLFQRALQDCATVGQVFSLLEVPGDTLSQLAASYALERLAQLQGGVSNRVDTFIKKAVFNELCDTATANVFLVTNERLINLVKCYLNANSFPKTCIMRLNLEIEKRIGDGVFSINEIASLIDLLSNHVMGDLQLLDNLFIHLGARYMEITEMNVKRVFSVLKNNGFNLKQKNICMLLNRQVKKFWWKLQPADITEICKSVCMIYVREPSLLHIIGSWLFVHIYEITDKQLVDILAALHLANFGDENVTRALDRFLSVKIDMMSKKAVAMSMDYYYGQRYLSPKVLDAVAEDFIKNHVRYSSSDMYHTLRVFGYLNYMPNNSPKLFMVIDQILSRRFADFEAHQILEMLASFSYLKLYPKNFLNKVFTPHFLARIQGVETKMVKQQALHHLRLLYCTAKLEMHGHLPSFINDDILKGHYSSLRGQWMNFHQDLAQNLLTHATPEQVEQFKYPSGVPYFIDFKIYIDRNGQWMSKKMEKSAARRVAILTVMPEHMCTNSGHLLGEYAMRRRHLQLLGYTTMEVEYDRYMSLSTEDKKRFVEDLVKQCGAPLRKPSDSVFNSVIGDSREDS